jgi:hypothetical protein
VGWFVARGVGCGVDGLRPHKENAFQRFKQTQSLLAIAHVNLPWNLLKRVTKPRINDRWLLRIFPR